MIQQQHRRSKAQGTHYRARQFPASQAGEVDMAARRDSRHLAGQGDRSPQLPGVGLRDQPLQVVGRTAGILQELSQEPGHRGEHRALPVIDQPRVDAGPDVDRKAGEESGVPDPRVHFRPGNRATEKPPWNTAAEPVSIRYSGASGRRFFSERPPTEGSTRKFRPSHRMYGEPSTRTPARWSDVTSAQRADFVPFTVSLPTRPA